MLYFWKAVSSRISNMTRPDQGTLRSRGPYSITCVLVVYVCICIWDCIFHGEIGVCLRVSESRLQCQSKKAPAPLNNNINIDEDSAQQQTGLRSVRWSFRIGVCSVWEVAVLVAESRVRGCHSKKAHQLLLLPGRATGERCCCLFCQLPIASESTWRKGHSNHHDLPLWQTHRLPVVRRAGGV